MVRVIDICLGVYLRGLLLIFAPFCLASDSTEGVWGIQEVSTGGMLEGNWVDEKAHGRMTYIINGYKLYYFFDHGNNLGSSEYYYDLDNYAGGFDEYGRRSGFGAFDYKPDADQLYVGEWREDVRDGIGAYFFSDGEVYIGLYMDNVRKGDFIVISPDGVGRQISYGGVEEGEVSITNERDDLYSVAVGDSIIEYDGNMIFYLNKDKECRYDFKEVTCTAVGDD